MPFPVLEGDRIVLKEMDFEYEDDVFGHFSNEKVNDFVDFDACGNMKDAREIIEWGLNLWKEGKGVLWGIFRKSDGTFLGQVNYVKRKNDNFQGDVHRAEIGFDLHPDYWG